MDWLHLQTPSPITARINSGVQVYGNKSKRQSPGQSAPHLANPIGNCGKWRLSMETCGRTGGDGNICTPARIAYHFAYTWGGVPSAPHSEVKKSNLWILYSPVS